MRAEPNFPLELEYVREASPAQLMAEIRNWLVGTNPDCLIHPHGFFVVALKQTEIGDWRFHFWPAAERQIRGMPAFIHTHDRHVDSRILSGRLTNITYEIEMVKSGGLPLYEVGYGGNRYEKSTSNFLRKTNSEVTASIINIETLTTGQHYRIDRHVYHEARVDETSWCATIVLMHSRTPGAVNVVGCDGYPDEIAFTRKNIAGADLAMLLPS